MFLRNVIKINIIYGLVLYMHVTLMTIKIQWNRSEDKSIPCYKVHFNTLYDYTGS